MKKNLSRIKDKVLSIVRKLCKALFLPFKKLLKPLILILSRIWDIVTRPFKKLFGKIIIRLPHKYRIRVYNLQKRFESPRIKYALVVVLIIGISGLVVNHIRNDHHGLPWNEKVADGVWILHNREPVHQVLASPGKGPNLKENKQISKDPNKQMYKWSARLPSGTVFEFGGVTSDTPVGKVIPEVRVRDKNGWFVVYVPKYESRIKNQESSEKNHNSEFVIHDSVTPSVKGNVISWEISPGITARYEMLTDRVKADYIIDSKDSFCHSEAETKNLERSFTNVQDDNCNKYQLDFDVSSGKTGSNSANLASQGVALESGELEGELMPEGNINWFTGSETAPQNIFVFPAPVVNDSKTEASADAKALAGKQNPKSEINSNYELQKINDGKYTLAIVLDKGQLEKASFPLTIDPVVIDSSSTTTGTAYGNSRKILRDTWGNLIALFDGGAGDDNVYYKNYDSTTWTDAGIDLDESTANSAQYIAADIDSSGNAYAAFKNSGTSNLEYAKLYVMRSGNNTISRIVPLSVEDVDTSGAGTRPSLIVANKGGGDGVEKVVISYSMSTSGREEARVITRDTRTDDYAQEILSDSSLVGYFRLGESDSATTAMDLSTTKNNGTYTNTPSLGETGAITGDSDTGTRFNGTDEYVNVPDNNVYDFGTGDFSLEAWVKRPSVPGGAEFILGHSGDNDPEDWELFWRSGNDGLSSRLSGTSCDSDTTTDISDGKWHHVVVTMDRDGYCTWYKDGSVSGTPTDISSKSSLDLTNTSPLYIARRASSGYFNGAIDEVAIYNKVLSTSEVQDHFNKGYQNKYYNEVMNTSGLVGYWKLDELSGTTAVDSSSTGNNGTYTGGYTLGMQGGQPGASSSAVKFNGTSGYVTIPDNNAYSLSTTNKLTVAFWCTPNHMTSDGAVVSKGTAGNYEWAIYRESDSGFYAGIYQTSGTGVVSIPGPGGLSPDRSYFVVLTMDESTDTAKFYVNGVLFGTYTTWTGSTGNGTSPVNIGRRADNAYYYNGIADEVSIYNKVLTDDEIQRLYDYGATWKNASEEKFSATSCSDTSTDGGSGLPNSGTCRGVTDQVLNEASNTSVESTVNQFPGSEKRSPDSVKWDDAGSFSNLTNTYDNSTSTNNNINGFTTADYIYIGDDKPFSKVTFDMNNTNSNTVDLSSTTVEYCSLSYNGSTCDAWSDLPDFKDNTDNGTSTFSEDGSVFFSQPDSWVKNTVDSTTDKYWIRLRPSAALDSQVEINEIYINDRNANALLVTSGINNSDDLRASYIVWDDITNSRWEDNPAVRGDGTRDDAGGASSALDNLGANWGTYTNFPLSSTVDTKNNRVYVGYVEDSGTDVLHVKTIADNKDPTVASNWTDTGFPTVTEASTLSMSLSSDQSDVYAFYILDGTSTGAAGNLMYARCTGIAATHNGVCDSSNDWGTPVTLNNDNDIPALMSHPSVIATKLTSDVVGFDTLFTDTTNSDVNYERAYADLMDRTITVAASGDDATNSDCTTTDLQSITDIAVIVGGLGSGDYGCTVSGAANGGVRFPNVNVAKGVKISSAYLDVEVYITGTNPAFTIYGEDTDNASAFTAVANCSGNPNCIQNRTKTTSSKVIGATNYYKQMYRFDVTDLVQEIVCRGAPDSGPCTGDLANTSGNWTSGNALVLMLMSDTNAGSANWLQFSSFDDTDAGEVDPNLEINCETSCTATSAATVSSVWCQIGTVGGSSSTDCNENWKARKKITFDNRASGENLTNFPVLVRLDSSKIDYAKVQNAGQDLRFVDANGTTLLDYDIEKWDEAGESLVWVNVPQIDSGVASDFVWMYYDNSAGSAGLNENGTWNSNYKAVYHLKENPASTCSGSYEVCDSTSNTNNGDANGSMTSADQVIGQIGSAIDFDGSNDYIDMGDVPELEMASSDQSISGWFRIGAVPPDGYGMIARKSIGGSPGSGYETDINGSGNVAFDVRTNTIGESYTVTSSKVYTDSNWHYYEYTLDRASKTAYLYVDGILIGSDTSTQFPNDATAESFNIGGQLTNYSFYGSLDEIRVSSDYQSADWIEASYLNQKSDSTFVSIGAEQNQPNSASTTSPSAYYKEIMGTPGLVGYFRLGEPTSSGTIIARDSSSTGNDGTYINTPTLNVTGPLTDDPNTAITIDGATQYVRMPDNNAYDFGSGDFSLEIWFKYASTGSYSDWLISKDNQFALLIDSTGDLVLDNFVDHAADSNVKVNGDTNWHHAVATRDGNTYKLYLDGRDVTGVTATQTFTANSTDLFIGVESSLGSSLYFEGSLDEAALYNVALTPAQVLKHYQLGSGSPVNASGGTRKFSKGFTSPLFSSLTDLGSSFSTSDYAAVEGDDGNYAVISGNLNSSASTSAVPMYMFKVNNPSNSNATEFNVSAVVKSSVAPSSRPVYLQVFNANLNNWMTLASNSSAALDTDVTLSASSSTLRGDLPAFYANENPGTGTRYAKCSDGSSNCWLYFRVYQEAPGSAVSENLSLDMFDLEFGETQAIEQRLKGKTRLRGGTRLR